MTPQEPGVPSGPVRVVHLHRADYEDAEVRAAWHARGFSTLSPVEGHDPDVWCPVCSRPAPGIQPRPGVSPS